MTPFWSSMFKTMFRQPARTQHKKVTDSYVVHLLTAIFDDFGSSLLLYFGGAGVYRRRWDFLLRVLQIPKRVALTPGGLQGGGAVHAYRSNLDLPSLLWRMCGDVRSLLDETAALTASLAVLWSGLLLIVSGVATTHFDAL